MDKFYSNRSRDNDSEQALRKWIDTSELLTIFEESRDNYSVLQLMNSAPMHLGGLELVYDRSPHFNALLECRAPRNVTILGKHADVLLGFFSISICKKWLRGKKISCGYIGDFRTNGSRKAAIVWRQVYARILQLVQSDPKLDQPEFFLTAILKENLPAVRSLVFPKTDLGFYYRQLCEIQMINVFAMLPWGYKSVVRVQTATSEDENQLKKFINTHENAKAFGQIFDDSSDCAWKYRKDKWPDFKIENFLILKNTSGSIVACTLPWNPGFAKRMRVQKAPFWLRIFCHLGAYIGLKLPRAGESFETIYLTHLHSDDSIPKDLIVRSFIAYLSKSSAGQNAHLISYIDDQDFSKKISGLLKQSTTVVLFEVTTDKQKKCNLEQQISFETGLV